MAGKRETAKALKGSIEKWRAIVEKRGVDDGSDNCPLCSLFWEDAVCNGCPAAVSSTGCCTETPYVAWYRHQEKKHPSTLDLIHCPTCTRLAKAELKFLESLNA